MTTKTKEDVLVLVKMTQEGSEQSFRELEEVAKPLLISLSNRFASFHSKFEFDDFYSIGLHALHKACMSFNEGNPSFLNYAKVIILRSFWREIEHWNQGKRDIFQNSEVPLDKEEIQYQDDFDEIAFMCEFRERVNIILDECFDDKKAMIIRMYIFKDKQVVHIANELGLNYKSTHKIIERGMIKLKNEYVKRFVP